MTVTGPLAGYTVAVTAQRRSEEQTALLERRGARVVAAATLRIVPLPDDDALREATLELLDHPPDITIATTGIGFRGWLEAADGWGVGERLREVLGRSRLWARGPKALGAIRAAGLREDWSAPSECGWEVIARLEAEAPRGRRVAVQLHGDPADDYLTAIVSGGGTAVAVPVYRCALPTDVTAVGRMVDMVCGRRIDAITFTSAPAVNALLRIAGSQADDLVAALRAAPSDGGVLAVAVGPVTAAPLLRWGIPVAQPERSRLGALVRTVSALLPDRAGHVTLAGGHRLEVRGHLVLVDGEPYALPPAPMAVLRELVSAGGKVLSRRQLLRRMPGGADEHAVEMAVNRLRDGLDLRDCVKTVIKRGYRLNTD